MTTTSSPRALSAMPLWFGAFLALAVTAVSLEAGMADAALRQSLRVTGRVAFICFVLCFVATPTAALFAAPWSRWLAQRRRDLGLTVAGVQAVHVVLIAALVLEDPAVSFGMTVLVGGGVGLLLLFLLAVTSFAPLVQALGPVWWKRLHRFGLWYLAMVFVFDFWVRPFRTDRLLTVAYAPFAMLLLAAFAVRIGAWARRRRSAGAARLGLAEPGATSETLATAATPATGR